jgi:hypothetical protein
MCLECSWNTHEMILYIYIYKHTHTRTLISHTVPNQCIKQCMNQFSKTQRSVATVGYDELWWTSLSSKLSPISSLQKSDVLSESKCCLCVVAAFCVHSVESDEGVWGVEEFDIYRAGEGEFYLTDRMTRRILQMFKVTWLIKKSNTQAVQPTLFICPVICNFNYQSIYRSRSLSRYCS